ncbi:hypothetical protein FRC01_014857 [Tulasnella sp. 417]|nr:hypothetical protein FRC01_014857 [Tulasnella sp. 417]
MLWSAIARAASLLLFSQVAISAVTFTNPIKNPNGSDPFMVYDGGYYYLTTTTWTNVQITRATTIAGLKTATPKVVYTDSNSARCCNVWAPEIHKIDGKWWLYYTAGQSANLDLQRSHVLQGGSSPWDSYTYKGQLKATNAPDAWSIDGTVLTVNGANYFVFSSFSPNNLQSLYIAPMTNAYTLGARSLLSEPLNSWERVDTPVNEGPVALYKNGAIYLAFSASFCWTSSYSLGLLKYNGGTVTSASSWTKSGPVFTSANGHYGPGHNGFFTAPDGAEGPERQHTGATHKCRDNHNHEDNYHYYEDNDNDEDHNHYHQRGDPAVRLRVMANAVAKAGLEEPVYSNDWYSQCVPS